MEHIRQAVERAKADDRTPAEHLLPLEQEAAPLQPQPLLPPAGNGRTAVRPSPTGGNGHADLRYPEVVLKESHLTSKRVISHDISDARAKSFDMLRTQVLQAMDQKAWQVVAVTSPAPGCGKTLTAVNLAISIARRSERSVLLVDMDLQKPQVSSYLGLECDDGLPGVLEGRLTLENAIVKASIARHKLMVLPTLAAVSGSAELLASPTMTAMLQKVRRDYRSTTVILDLPPLLSSDDAIAILPQVDCVLLVAAAGNTTVAQIEECSKHLLSTEVLRVVLNKVPEKDAKEYCSY